MRNKFKVILGSFTKYYRGFVGAILCVAMLVTFCFMGVAADTEMTIVMPLADTLVRKDVSQVTEKIFTTATSALKFRAGKFGKPNQVPIADTFNNWLKLLLATAPWMCL